MRRFRAVRLFVIPAVTVPLAISTLVLSAPAWAKAKRAPITCQNLTGTNGGTWNLSGCTESGVLTGATPPNGTLPTLTGYVDSAPTAGFDLTSPTPDVQVNWGEPNPGQTPLVTTFSVTIVKPYPGRKDKCADPSAVSEYKVTGKELSNSTVPQGTVKGKMLMFVCVQNSNGSLTDFPKRGDLPKPLKF